MEDDIVLEVFTKEEAANLLHMKPERISEAISSGELKVESEHYIPGPALSAWWQSQGGSAVCLEDYLSKIPWLPVIYIRAIELFEHRDIAREWLNTKIPALGGKTPLEYAEKEAGAIEVMDLLGRLEHGVFS